MYESVMKFLSKVKSSGETYKYNVGDDVETVKFDKTDKRGRNIYYFSQYEKKDREPYYSDFVNETELFQILTSPMTVREYRHSNICK